MGWHCNVVTSMNQECVAIGNQAMDGTVHPRVSACGQHHGCGMWAAGDVAGSGPLLWPNGSGAISSQGSGGGDDHMGQHLAAHRALLAARAGSGLDGVEVGPMLGRGSYGRVYRCAQVSLPSISIYLRTVRTAPPPLHSPPVRAAALCALHAVHQTVGYCTEHRVSPQLLWGGLCFFTFPPCSCTRVRTSASDRDIGTWRLFRKAMSKWFRSF